MGGTILEARTLLKAWTVLEATSDLGMTGSLASNFYSLFQLDLRALILLKEYAWLPRQTLASLWMSQLGHDSFAMFVARPLSSVAVI